MAHGSVDQVVSRNGPFHPVEESIFLGPVHETITAYGEETDDGMKRNKKAHEQVLAHDVDVFLANVEVIIFMKLVKFGLV